MKFSLQEQNKKSRVGKNTTKWFNEHSNGKKDHIFQLRLIWFSTLFTGIEVFFQIVHFFFIDMCCKSLFKIVAQKGKMFFCVEEVRQEFQPITLLYTVPFFSQKGTPL